MGFWGGISSIFIIGVMGFGLACIIGIILKVVWKTFTKHPSTNNLTVRLRPLYCPGCHREYGYCTCNNEGE